MASSSFQKQGAQALVCSKRFIPGLVTAFSSILGAAATGSHRSRQTNSGALTDQPRLRGGARLGLEGHVPGMGPSSLLPPPSRSIPLVSFSVDVVAAFPSCTQVLLHWEMGLRDGPRVAEGHTPGASYQKAKGGCAKTTISCESQVSLAISWFISSICGARPYGKTSPFIS